MLKFKHSYCNKCVIVSTMVIEKHIRQMASKQNTPTAIHKSLFHRRKFDNDQETVTRKLRAYILQPKAMLLPACAKTKQQTSLNFDIVLHRYL